MSRQFELPKNWRERLPTNPVAFYRERIPGFGTPDALGAIHGHCPMHVDSAPTFTVTAAGFWRCFGGCGSGNLIEFAMRLRAFSSAVLELIEEPR